MNQKYLPDGQAVEIISEIPNGFLVSRIFEDADTGETINGKPELVAKVYDKAPTERMDKEFLALQSSIDDLYRKQREAGEALQIAKAAIEGQKAKFDRVEQLRLLEDFIDGKITHYVEFTGYSEPRIIPFAETKSDEYCGNRDMRLLSLFGSSNGQLSWMLNRYRDGSGIYTEVFPCNSLEAAQTMVKERILAKADESKDGPIEHVVTSAEKFGVELPIEYLNLYHQQRVADYQQHVTKQAQELQKYYDLIEQHGAKIK